jgi:iron(III) transport system substrate-binding protein
MEVAVTAAKRTWRAGRAVLFVVVVSALVVGCGSSPTGGGGGEVSKKDTATAAVKKLNAQLKGLDPKARRAKLIELAKKEGGSVNGYGSMNLDEADPIINKFQDATGIDVNYYRANSEDVLNRVIEESKANFKNGADVVFTNGPEMTILERKGLFASFDTPTTAHIAKQGVHPTWKWFYINTFTPAWNTKQISPAEAPKSWEDVLTKYNGKLAMELSDVDWFATLVKEYFIKQKGMTEAQAIQLFKKAASGAKVVDGHTLMTELLAGGEFGIAASPYLHRIRNLQGKGASLEWQPAIEPLIVRPNGVAIHATANHPASALLFTEFLLTDAQSQLLDIDRQPASSAVKGGGLPTKYKNIVVNVQTVIDELDKWTKLYEDVVKQSGKKVIEK